MKTELRGGFWAVLLVGLFACAPTAYPGYWQALEGFVPVFNASQNRPVAAIATDVDLWRGMGNATFLLTRPLIRIGMTPVDAVCTVFAMSFILGGLSVYVWLRQRLGDRVAGLAGAIYVLLPPFLATVYVRGSLSDAQIMALLPLALAGAATFTDNRRPSSAGFIVLSMLWMWRVQAGLAVFATLLLLLYAFLVERDRLTILVVAVSGVAGLVSLIPLWAQTAPTAVHFSDHYVYLFQLLIGGWQVAPSIAGWQDAYPFQVGLVALIFGLLSLWFWRTRTGARTLPVLNRLLAFSAMMSAFLMLLSMGISDPIWQLTRGQRLLTYPWQIILLAAPWLTLLAGSLPALLPSLASAPYWVALIAMTVISSYPYLTTHFTQLEPPRVPVATVGAGNDFVLLNTEMAIEEATRVTLDVQWQTLRPPTFDYSVFFQAVQPGGAGVIGQLDVQPIDGTRPMTTWVAGEILTDTYRLDLAASPSLNGLEYHFGYYDWRDGTRLPMRVIIADGAVTLADDKLVLHGR